MTDLKIENAIRLLTKYFDWKEILKKPTLLHSVRVWLSLVEKWYDEEVYLSWFLHDILEDTEILEDEIIKLFSNEILEIVKANTKDKNISKEFINEELINRCALFWEKALIVKSADILDNYKYYAKINSEKWVERCFMLAELILKNKNENYSDKIFNELNLILCK